MQDRSISLGCVLAGVLWALTAAFMAAGMVVGFVTDDDHVSTCLLASGLACSAGGATASVRNMIHKQNAMLRGAFELGVEAGALRSVRR